ncbi:hypothetical protein VaNZ11_016194 [Volvox africanus]|uniref:Retrotransposon gag domain-containing protein n=1 Tax=Volvox africanus TaxID=51714 RepID=A0ABQ5SNB4_9CHLO|nr:hypothetical protein VaNZ11_016194 [Volvox africanus]
MRRGENVPAYQSHFEALVTPIANLTEDDRVFWFQRGLPKLLAKWIRLGKLWLWISNLELLALRLLSRHDARTDSVGRVGALAQVSTDQGEQVRARTQQRAESVGARRRRQPCSALTPMQSGRARMTHLCRNGIATNPSSSVGRQPMFAYGVRRAILPRIANCCRHWPLSPVVRRFDHHSHRSRPQYIRAL